MLLEIHKLAAWFVMPWAAWKLQVRLKCTSECGHNTVHPSFHAVLLEDEATHRLYRVLKTAT